MKTRTLRLNRFAATAFVSAVLGIATTAFGQNFDVGSDGRLGDVVITNNTVMDLPGDGILHFRSLQVNGGTTLSFNKNPRNTAVFILSQGEIVVNGTISVDGGAASINTGGVGGPGGFDGGKPGFGPEVPPGDGYGPGGGSSGTKNDCNTVADPTSGSFGTVGFGASAGTYGTSLIIPLIGGSGGGGGVNGNTAGGGGGAGAIMLAANTRIRMNGTISAMGGRGGSCNNAGSGGAIRLVAFNVSGGGTLQTIGGSTPNRGSGAGGMGRVRVDTVIRNELSLNIVGISSIGGNLLVFPPSIPSLNITEAAGNVITNGSGPVTFILPFGSSTNQLLKIRASDFGRNVPLRVTVTPDSGIKRTFDAEVDNSTTNPVIVTVPVTIPVNTLVTVHCWTR